MWVQDSRCMLLKHECSQSGVYAESQEALLVLGHRCAASDLGAGSITGLCHLPGLLLPADYHADDSGGGDHSAGTLPAL